MSTLNSIRQQSKIQREQLIPFLYKSKERFDIIVSISKKVTEKISEEEFQTFHEKSRVD